MHTRRPQEFPSEGSVLFRPSYEVASNKFYLFDCKLRNQHGQYFQLPEGPRGQILDRAQLESLSSSTQQAYFFLLCWRSIFFLLVQSNLTCTWFEVAANENHTIFFGTGKGYGKVKKTKQFLTPKKNTKGMRSRIYDAGWLRHPGGVGWVVLFPLWYVIRDAQRLFSAVKYRFAEAQIA